MRKGNRKGNKGQGLVLAALAGLAILTGISAWLLLSDRPNERPVVERRAGQTDAVLPGQAPIPR
jgi:hypothetical protein